MHEYYMNIALKQAQKAYKKGEVPIGAIIVCNNRIISKSYNKVEKYQQSIKHAEIIAIKKANKKLKRWRLNDCTLYVTLQPCLMCTGAIIQSRIKTVVYATDSNYLNTIEKDFLHEQFKKNKITVQKNICKEQSILLLQQFFNNKRIEKKHL